jgi:flagellar biosynthesis protein FliR
MVERDSMTFSILNGAIIGRVSNVVIAGSATVGSHFSFQTGFLQQLFKNTLGQWRTANVA